MDVSSCSFETYSCEELVALEFASAVLGSNHGAGMSGGAAEAYPAWFQWRGD